MKRRSWWIASALVATAALAAIVTTLPDSSLVVETATISRGALAVTVDEEGRSRVRDRYVVAAPVGGRLTRITARDGQHVTGGDVLARIEPSPQDPRAAEMARSQLAAAEARRLEAVSEVENTRAQHEQSGRDLARSQTLAEANAISQTAFEQARLAASSAERQLEMRRAALRAADADVARARAALIGAGPASSAGSVVIVRAPSAGRVLRVLEESARVVMAGAPLIEIGDAAGLEVVVDVLSEDAVAIEPGQPVLFDRWGGATELRGHVRLIEPEAFTKVSALGVEEQRVNIIADLREAPPSLGVGYRVDAHITTWSGENVLRVPTSALFRLQDGWAAFAVVDGRAARRTLRLGHRSTDTAEVLEGLGEGDRVILYPSALIEDGVRVR